MRPPRGRALGGRALRGGSRARRRPPLSPGGTPFRPRGPPRPAAGRRAPVLGGPRLPQSTLAVGLTPERLSDRRSLVQQADDHLHRLEGQLALDQFDRSQSRAFNLLTSTTVRSAFDLDREDPRLRDRYGRTLFGNST